jgi:hypothetical protein
MRRWTTRPRSWALAYFVAILAFAILYFLLPPTAFNRRLSAVDAVYFSVITITTVGFGDIVPGSDTGKVLVILQATAGVVIVGLFLAALWRDFTDRLEASHAAQLLASQRKVHLTTFFAYWRYIETTIADYRTATAEATTPMGRRDDVQAYDPAFRFSDMRDVLGPTAEPHAGRIRPLLVRYFEIEGQLANDLKYLLTNFAITAFPEVRDLVIRFLSLVRSAEVRDSLLAIRDERLGAELHDAIAAQAGEPIGTQVHAAAMMAPLIAYAAGIRTKMRVLHELEEAVRRLATESMKGQAAGLPPAEPT